MPPRITGGLRPGAPANPSQISYLNHLFPGQNSQASPKPPTPQQRSAQTRTRNAQRTRVQSVQPPDYEPHMQDTGQRRAPRVTSSGEAPSATRARIASGGRVSVGAYELPKPPPGQIKIPSGYTAELGTGAEKAAVRVVPQAAARGFTAGAGETAVNVIKGASKFAVRGALGTVGAVIAPAIFADQAEGSSGGADAVMAARSPRLAREYIQYKAAGAKAAGQSRVEIPPNIYDRASNATANISEGGSPRPTARPAKKPTVRFPATHLSAPAPSQPPAPAPKRNFVRNAYAKNKEYNSTHPDHAIATSQAYSAAMNKFKKSHAWARNTSVGTQRDLNAAVTYLANTRHKAYFSA